MSILDSICAVIQNQINDFPTNNLCRIRELSFHKDKEKVKVK